MRFYTTQNTGVYVTRRGTHTSGEAMATLQLTRHSAAARLDRLPITSAHRQIMWIVAVVFFFELGDLNTFAFAAPAVMKLWNLSVSTISHIVSWTFFGMFIRAVKGGWISDSLGC